MGQRNTEQQSGPPLRVELLFKMKGSGTTLYKGTLIALDSSGYAVAGTAAGSLTTAGVAVETVTNDGADGAKSIRLQRGVWKFENKVGDEVTQALVLKSCYFEDAITVRATSAGSSVAGKVIQVDSDGVWVQVGP